MGVFPLIKLYADFYLKHRLIKGGPITPTSLSQCRQFFSHKYLLLEKIAFTNNYTCTCLIAGWKKKEERAVNYFSDVWCDLSLVWLGTHDYTSCASPTKGGGPGDIAQRVWASKGEPLLTSANRSSLQSAQTSCLPFTPSVEASFCASVVPISSGPISGSFVGWVFTLGYSKLLSSGPSPNFPYME